MSNPVASPPNLSLLKMSAGQQVGELQVPAQEAELRAESSSAGLPIRPGTGSECIVDVTTSCLAASFTFALVTMQETPERIHLI